MIIDNKIATVEGNAVFSQTTGMTFDAASIPFIIRSLTDMYSDPYAAIVREYTSNAYDSHVLAAQTRAVEVRTPTYLNSNFIVQDFGIGMSRDELNDIYSKYGASTKRETNNQIGAFGLGAKSALAVVSQFSIVSVKDGKKNTVIISKDETGVGALNFLGEVDTDAENGVTVSIPITDAHRLNEAIASKDIFLGWPKDSINVNGKPVEKAVANSDQYLALGEIGWLKKNASANDYYGYREQSFSILVGPVSYKIETKNLGEHGVEAKEFFKSNFKDIVLSIPNGSVDLTPNREELVYSPRTIATLVAALENMVTVVTEHLQVGLNDAKTIREAFTSAIAIRQRGFAQVELTWNGVELPTIINFSKDADSTPAITRTRLSKKSKASHDRIVRPENRVSNEVLPFPTFAKWDASYGNFSSGSANDLSDIVLVVGANAPTLETSNHSVVSNISAYFKARVANGSKTDAGVPINGTETVFTLSDDLGAFDEWFVGMAKEVIQARDIMAFALAERKEREAERKKAAGDLGTVKAVGIAVPVAAKISGGSVFSNQFKISTVNTAELPEDTKYIVLSEQSEADSKFTAIKTQIHLGLRSSESFYQQRSWAKHGVVGLLMAKGYTVVSLPKSRKVERVVASLGAENVFDFDVVFPEIVESMLDSLSLVERDWLTAFYQSVDFSWATTKKFIEALDQIEDEESRNFAAINSDGRSAALAALTIIGQGTIQTDYFNKDRSELVEKRLVKLTTLFGETIANKLIVLPSELSSKKATMVHSYPLLAHAHYDISVNNVIEYINLKDAARNA